MSKVYVKPDLEGVDDGLREPKNGRPRDDHFPDFGLSSTPFNTKSNDNIIPAERRRR